MKLSTACVLCFVIALTGSGLILGNTEGPYQLSEQIQSTFLRDSTAGKTDRAAYAFSFMGEYQQALIYNDKDYTPRWTLKGVVKASDSLFLQACKPVKATDYIIRQARSKQIIIINEAHHNSLHRVFTASLLKGLYQAGFRYFGAETLNFRDSSLNQRKYPVIASGYYTKEPQYGNLIREALKLGYHVFPYEATTDEEFASGKSREIAQARHIETILKQDPKAKILLHCGYDHVVEVPLTNSWQKAMAGRLKEFTGIDPMTIDQQQWTELSQPTKEHPLYQSMQLVEASIYINTKGEVYPGLSLGRTDVQVAHPRTRYQYGRPTWLLRANQWKPYFLKQEQCSLNLPCLALAYRADEPIGKQNLAEQPIPVDVVELVNWQERKALILPTGRYRVVFRDSSGNQQETSLFHK